MQNPLIPRVLRTRDFVKDAVSLILETGREAVARNGIFRLGLAGGGTPRAVYKALANHADGLPWECVQITFGDERCVPSDSSESNFHMAFESLLCRVPLPVGNVFQIRGDLPPDEAAAQCEAQLAAFANRLGEPVYRHDLLLLGLGEDGHTASLFPGSPALEETRRLVVATTGPKPPPQRVTFTFPLLNASRKVAFLLNDPKKEAVLEGALRGDFPAGKVQPTDGEVIWIVGS
jgi:6-phosphogluconolactonase